MNVLSFTFCGARLAAMPSGALFWQDEAALVVSDLHLGKAERMARRGGPILPPYEVIETLDRLLEDIAKTAARTVICLGDSFDDLAAARATTGSVSQRLAPVMAGRRWIWIEGNHDPGPVDLSGEHLAEYTLGPLTFRHIAQPTEPGEISGHYHPKAQVRLKGRTITRRCFLIDDTRLIMPAYGTYTGGLYSGSPVLSKLMAPNAQSILTGPTPTALPMPR
ncbi:ligase-associated DNA damage response endonuclease PdeM [Gymnodinialimonas ceratoperidinii]|uniref:Ligase-associated DNA damage response endonuclease PdeM n=1 Tax=Gymnodinialimonas ceratoperidinii TaxID=2856823 RepID=A0A8F6TWP1_9RHOB|nr:ligase-associated DNA damage response endonuclease PdeM [Gymnodinialimonas ceratoperidinii]QXT39318.1 ligase-associated DNA damage response endonuclease PdeM [Gymnodinialimonas ceratoperidinii]